MLKHTQKQLVAPSALTSPVLEVISVSAPLSCFPFSLCLEWRMTSWWLTSDAGLFFSTTYLLQNSTWSSHAHVWPKTRHGEYSFWGKHSYVNWLLRNDSTHTHTQNRFWRPLYALQENTGSLSSFVLYMYN